jgi:putative transposase
MQPTMTSDIVIRALLMAVRQRPKATQVIVHSDQESQYASGDYRDFLKAHSLTPSMSRREHCLDSAVVESFFHPLKTERVKRKVYAILNEAKADFFDYVEVLYNRTRLHSHLGHVSPDEYETMYSQAS